MKGQSPSSPHFPGQHSSNWNRVQGRLIESTCESFPPLSSLSLSRILCQDTRGEDDEEEEVGDSPFQQSTAN